jgi:hypothetical protein
MSITIKKVTEKNTKKQILEEYDKAVKLIDELKSNLKKSESLKQTSSPVKITQQVAKEEPKTKKEDISVDNLIDGFNLFSNNLKDDMTKEIKIIEELKEQINKKQDSIKNIYSSDISISLEKLIGSYKHILKEQENNLSAQKDKSIADIEDKKRSFEKEKNDYIEKYLKKQDEFKLSSSRIEKEDLYNKNKSINRLKKERNELLENTKSKIDDLKYEYKTVNIESYKSIEAEQKEQSEIIAKSESQKKKFEQIVNVKVTSVITKEKSSNTQKLDSLVEEYANKISLKNTQFENFKDENNALSSQIEELINELNTVQEKAHTLASKTIDSKSSTQSFEAMKDVAMEQARGKK